MNRRTQRARSLIRKSVQSLAAYLPGEQPAAEEIIKLNTNENPYPPSPRIMEILLALEPEKLRLYPDPLSMKLRNRIARIHECETSQVFVGNGSDEVLALCARAFVENSGSIGYFNIFRVKQRVILFGLRSAPTMKSTNS